MSICSGNTSNLNYLRKRCAEYTDKDLLKYFLVEEEEYTDEAIEIFKQEFERRGKSIQALLEEESDETGSLEHQIYQSRIGWYGVNEDISGNTFLTSKGLFFVPERIFPRGSYPYGLGAMHLGAIGLIFDEVVKASTEKISIIRIDQKNTPFSLITKILDRSVGVKISEILHVDYWVNGSIDIKYDSDLDFRLFFKRDEMYNFVDWLTLHNIPAAKKETTMERFLGILRRKPKSIQAKPESLSNKLLELKNVFEDGLITKDEYAAKRQKILDQY